MLEELTFDAQVGGGQEVVVMCAIVVQAGLGVAPVSYREESAMFVRETWASHTKAVPLASCESSAPGIMDHCQVELTSLGIHRYLIVIRVEIKPFFLPPIDEIMLQPFPAETGLVDLFETPVEGDADACLDFFHGCLNHFWGEEVNGADFVFDAVTVEQGPCCLLSGWEGLVGKCGCTV
jgi:hypothetical protein